MNFDVQKKETFSTGITGVFGLSGSGKTSLLQSIAGLATPVAGRISIGGKVVFDAERKVQVPVDKRNIGYVFQE